MNIYEFCREHNIEYREHGMKEKWKWIVGYKGLYKISTHGRVKSVAHYTSRSDTGTERFIPGRILIPRMLRVYPSVVLYKNGKPKSYFVHKLMLETFIGPCPIGMESRHLDDIPTHNWIGNLVWGTHKQNTKDARVNNNGVHKNSKITLEQVKRIKKLLRQGVSPRKIWEGESFPISKNSFRDIVKGRTWRYVK